MGVAMGAVVDVFTLGGSMDAQDSTQMWTAAANQHTAAKQGRATSTYTPPPAAPQQASTDSLPAPTYTAPQPLADSTATSTPGSTARNDSPSGDEAIRNNCATIERYQGSWKAMNRCQEVVFVAFCHVDPDPNSWGSSLNCGNEQYGLAGPIKPGHNETISSPGSRANLNYHSRSFACTTVRGKMFTPSLSNQGRSGRCR